ncbi:hypothetical protein [Lysobacter firmicutimachus]|uniref:Uncharacterized protein n=1 Tax=Lysobacter firmicutimachus TaxID=1792846 RepID=A0ABU8CYJ8_9GAMM
MQFRHPDGARLALTTGHVTHVGPDWAPLHPLFHAEALAQGCECDQRTIRTRQVVVPRASDSAVKALDESELIRGALMTLAQRQHPGDLTGDGMPDLKVVASLCGFRAKKETVHAIWHDLVAASLADDTNDDP